MARFMYSDALHAVPCPKCRATKGQRCRTPGGRPSLRPHGERLDALARLPGYDPRDYEIEAADGPPGEEG